MTYLYGFLREDERFVHAVYLGVDAHAGAIVVHAVEAIYRIAHFCSGTVGAGCRIPVFHHFTRVPAFGVVHTGSHIEVLEQGKGGADGNFVLHTVLPVSDQVRLEEQVVLGLYAVLQSSGVAYGNLFVPFLFAHSFLSFEREDSGQRNVQVGQSHVDRRVAHVLCNVRCSRQRQFLVEQVACIADTGGLGVLRHGLRVVHVVDVGTLVATGGEVHTGRECLVGVGFGILAVRPHNLEVLGHRIVRQSLIARLGHLVAGLQQTGVFVSLDVVRLCIQCPRTFGEDVSPYFQVHLVADGKVVTSVGQTETTVRVVHISRHQESRLITA